MKKIYLNFIGISVIATTISLHIGLNEDKAISDLTLSNIEALASSNESGGGGSGSDKLHSYPCSHGGGQQCIRPNGVTGPSCSPLSYC